MLQAGVPQGSSLSPHLYILLVSNIFTKHCSLIITIKIGHHADDIALWTSDKIRARAVERINSALETVCEWMSCYRQKLNPLKSQAMIFTNKGTPNNLHQLKVRSLPLPWKEFVLYLGVYYDRTLSWKPQYEHILERVSSRMRILRKLCYNSPENNRLALKKNFGVSSKVALAIYKSFIRPVIEYGCLSFLTLKSYQVDKLQILQNEALRIALRSLRDTTFTVTLHKKKRISHFIYNHIKIRACSFVIKAMENDTLCGKEIKNYLNLLTVEELENTPLGTYEIS